LGPATITVIDPSNPLVDVVEAHRYVDTQKKTGNVVLIFDAGRRGRPEKEETCRARSRSRFLRLRIDASQGRTTRPGGPPAPRSERRTEVEAVVHRNKLIHDGADEGRVLREVVEDAKHVPLRREPARPDVGDGTGRPSVDAELPVEV
jgi:hypothetical protein